MICVARWLNWALVSPVMFLAVKLPMVIAAKAPVNHRTARQVTHPPTLGGFAARANETVWPAQPIERVETGVIIGKPCAQLGIVIVTALEGRGRKLLRHTYILCLPHSDGHPPFKNFNASSPTLQRW